MKAAIISEFEQAWNRRKKFLLLEDSQPLRVFHGPGEGHRATQELAIDRFGDHYWITHWADPRPGVMEAVTEFLKSKGARSAVELHRPKKGVPEVAQWIFGELPAQPFFVSEGTAKFLIRLEGVRHPGLFLDHQPLRSWLVKHTQGMRVLNTFAYTGSLSIAAAYGGASHVTTLDLSRPTLKWAEENWKFNDREPSSARWIVGDYFEWMPRLKREGLKFDCILLDPPSFSRGNKGEFSTSKNLAELHELAIALLEEQGILISSINSAQISREKFMADISKAAGSSQTQLRVLQEIQLPQTFPTRLENPSDRYLKGVILQKCR